MIVRAINEELLSEKYWKFGIHLNLPSEDNIRKNLDEIMSLLNAKLPENEELVIRKLLRIFKDITLVSLILRFSYPELYGIVSLPVTKITGISSDQPHKLYIEYLKKIREYKEKYNFDRTCDVDHAFWALAERTRIGKCKEEKCENYFYYSRDPEIICEIAYDLYGRGKVKEAIEELNKGKGTCENLEPIYETLMDFYEDKGDYNSFIIEGFELIEWYEEKKNYQKILTLCDKLLQKEKLVDVLEKKIKALKKLGKMGETYLCYLELIEEIKKQEKFQKQLKYVGTFF